MTQSWSLIGNQPYGNHLHLVLTTLGHAKVRRGRRGTQRYLRPIYPQAAVSLPWKSLEKASGIEIIPQG